MTNGGPRSATPRLAALAPLVFASGMCALVYQIAWLRELRLVFGASTVASAAVLAIFIGGLGVGAAAIGRRADRHPRPLALYARLEALIGISAAVTPVLLWLIREVYVQLGGSSVLGLGVGTALRLVLAALVLAVPTILMGGTLPAVVRAIETDDDRSRRAVAALYGVNTLGAVAGCAIATFFLLEGLGTRSSLWSAAGVNLVVAALAGALSRAQPRPANEDASRGRDVAPDGASAPPAPAWFVLAAAAVAGFVFFLMEIVWYRMLGPILGGTVFTFGLILAVALLGIGLGSAFYAGRKERRLASLDGLALVCVLEAACMAVPYVLGDRIAILALFLRPFSAFGFHGLVAGWAVVAFIVILPAAFVAGVQFPLLIALLGRGRRDVGRHVGLAYAWNTAGAIAGSLAGGFALLPALTAPGCWRVAVLALVALGLAAAILSSWSADRRGLRILRAPVVAAAVIAAVAGATGPTAAWRHSPIGAGRVTSADLSSENAIIDHIRTWRRAVTRELEGVESSVAMDTSNGLAFIINGKSDGNARSDAGTQVMGGLVGAILHPAPKRALVVGLGTGSTAGWLGVVPGIERVDVVELEAAIIEVARVCRPVNRDVLSNPRVDVVIGDAREVLLTTPRRYDVIFSEPSNPYRAGIASLLTQEFYRSVAERLEEDGLFLQWVQAYDVDGGTVRTIYATLQSVFPVIETWELNQNDLLLVASRRPVSHDVARLRARVAEEPFKAALAAAWRTVDLEGFLAHHVARPSLARELATAAPVELNTDDRTVIEFGFARTLGRPTGFSALDLRRLARSRGEDRPEDATSGVDWARVEDERTASFTAQGQAPPLENHLAPEQRSRAFAQVTSVMGDLGAARRAWRSQPRQPIGPTELAIVAEAEAEAGDEAAAALVERLRPYQPVEADAILARLRLRQGKLPEAAKALEASLERYRDDPWPLPHLMERALALPIELAGRDRTAAPLAMRVLRMPFPVFVLNEARIKAALSIASRVEDRRVAAQVLESLEPNVPWRAEVLALRKECYAATRHPLAVQAAADLAEFERRESPRWLPPSVRKP